MRAYNIQVNVGDLDHELAGLSDQDVSAWARGFQLGLHGRSLPAGHGASAASGNNFGYECHQKTKKFMEQAAEGGRRSAAVRMAKSGTAQPPKGVRGNAEGTSKVVRVNAEVTSNQKPVTYNKKQETDNPFTYGPTLPTRDGVGYRLPMSMAGDLSKAYPAVDLEGELNKMSIWLTANPAKVKTSKGMLRFINGWLGRVRGTPVAPTAEDAGPSEADYLACVEIAKSCEADKRAKSEQA